MSRVAANLDAGMDSGVCPSPDENYQSYYDAFPSLAASNILLCFCEKSHYKKDSFLGHDVCLNKRSSDTVRRTSSSSPPCRPNVTITKSCNSAPSPTFSDQTPSKRPKLLSSLKADIASDHGPKSDTVGCSNHREIQHSCPDLNSNRMVDPCFILENAKVPNFCCPLITQSVDGGTVKAHSTFTGNITFVTDPPKFVVPKCFKAASWPSKNEWRASNDVPFWSCGEWFCTLHKNVSFCAPKTAFDGFAQQQTDVATPAAQYVDMADEGDNAFRDEYYSAWMGEPKIACESGNEEDFEKCLSSDAVCDDGTDDMDMPGDDYFYDALVSDDNDLPPVNSLKNQIILATNISLTGNGWKCNSDTSGLGDPYSAWSVSGQIEIPSTYDQLKAVDNSSTVNLDAYWPEISLDNGCHLSQMFPSVATNLPEFDPYSSFGLKNIDLASSSYFQEVGFCMPKFIISPSNLYLQKSTKVANTGLSNAKNNCPAHPQQRNSHEMPSQSLLGPSTIQLNTAAADNCTKKSAAVPISPDTHFVPIRSESMEDAYFLKPGFDDSALHLNSQKTANAVHCGGRDLAYMEETGYYVYLEPDDAKNDDVESPPDDVCGLCAAKPSLSVQQGNKYMPLKISKSLGSFNAKCRSSFNSLPLKFRASKPGKMVQTEEQYFACRNYREAEPQRPSVGASTLDDSLSCDLDIDDLLAVEVQSGLSGCQSPAAPPPDAAHFEIWACGASDAAPLLFKTGQAGAQSRWSSSGDIKQQLGGVVAGGLVPGVRQPQLYRGATSLEGGTRGGGAEMELWLQQDARDEELLLSYVSNISLISPLDSSAAVAAADSGPAA